MTTQYTTILKLALPVQGELSGTWGDVVNDNITQMVEQAVAGKAVINTWTGNSHTLTTADGTTSESRCAILELTDSGTALTGAGTVVCPTNTKLYIVDNNTAQIITVKTSGGTGVAVPVGKTMLVYCDGTNVVEGVTHANSLSLGTSTVTADKILDEDNMASDSATAIATQQSIKAYVDSQVGTVDTLAEILANGNTTGANDIDVDSAQKVQFRDAAIYLNSSVDGQLDIVADGEVQIDTALVDINGNLDVSGTTNISGSVSFTKNAIAGVAISTTSRSSNTVTVTTSAVHGLTSGDLVNINGVANRSFNGYFTVSVSSTTVFTYSQTGADESSTGGTSTEIVYNLNASGTALNQMNGPLNIAANSGIDGLEITQSGSGEALSITGGNALFGDNDKAIFGIGNDLQIYHDGTHSYIKDAGTGQLRLLAGTNVQIWNSDATSLAANFNGDTQTSLYYAGAAKLATTSTGIDITGSVTADGLSVSGSTTTTFNSGAENVVATFTSTDTEAQIALVDTTGTSTIRARNDFRFHVNNAATPALKIDSNNDISFYEDTGTTAKFFWDASAESLGIGTTPVTTLDVKGSSDLVASFRSSTNNGNVSEAKIRAVDSDSSHVATFLFQGYEHRFQNASGVERLRIDAGGSLLIGKTTPADLHNTWNHIIIGEKGAIISENGAGGIDGITLADNAYIDADTGTYAYQTTGAASLIRQSGGVTQFSNAASGSAGAALTPVQTMAINADRKVDVGGVANQTTAVLNARFNGAAFEFGHGNNGAGYYGTAGSYGNNGQPYIGFSCDGEESVNTFTTRGAKGNIITGDLSGNLTFAQVTTASATGQTPTNRMTLDADGNFIVGNTSAFASSSFCVDQSGLGQFRRDGTPLIVRRDGSVGDLISFEDDGATVGGIRTGNGTLDINTASSTSFTVLQNGAAKMEIAGVNGSLYLYAQATGAGNADIRYTTSDGKVTYDTSSRLVKDEIEEIPYGLNTVMALSPKRYIRTDSDNKLEVGFIADEVVEVVPELVGMMEKRFLTMNQEDTEMVAGSVEYNKMTAVLVKAIQEQQATIEALTARIAALES